MTKELSREQQDRMKLQRDVKNMSVDDLYARLKQLGRITAHQIELMAIVAHELEERGEDLSPLRSGIGAYLKAVYEAKLAPETLVKLAGATSVLNAVAAMPVEIQREIVERGAVEVKTDDGVKVVKLSALTHAEMSRVFDNINRRVVPPEEQIAPKPRGDADMPRTSPLTFRLNEDEYKALQGHAERTKRSMQVLVIETLRENELLK